ncbi:putative sulfate exporter family transporter [Clostridium sp. DSM 8431]|uniref:YeiH family protein n=1 Tax=Clostridium sp. DSM 8431 TaxID=1761781 RepID=UPI000B7F3B7F|nr:putative sulfate exporter family transporter [Clostridium sp. DSM 8431]
MIPGFVVCFAIAIVSKGIAYFVPSLGAATFAIFLGIILGNTLFTKEVYNKGSKFSEGTLLSYSVVLMGATLNLSDIASVGVNGVIFIITQMTLTICVTYAIGRKLKFNRKFTLLMCAGNAVCGSSAIASVAPVIGEDSKDKALSITMVNITGTILMFVLPFLGRVLYDSTTMQTSGLIGGILQSVGQVIASAKFVSDDVVEMATIFKIIRIIMLVIVVFVFSKVNTKEEGKLFAKNKSESIENSNVKSKKFKISVPWFIIGFFILSIINSLGIIPVSVAKLAKFISGQFEIIALAAIGMRVKFKELINEGSISFLYGCLVSTCQIIIAITLIKLLGI